MSARRETPEARCVWLTEEFFESVFEEKDFERAIRWLRAQHGAAPADPAEAVAKAIFDSSRESDDECTWDDEPNEWIKQAYRDHESLAVLVALGYPDGSTRQENPT